MVIKSFVREKFEGKKQFDLQMQLMDSQMYTRRTNFSMMDSKPFRADRSCTYYSFDSLPCSGSENDNRCHYAAYYAFNNVSAPIRQLHRIYDEMNDALIYAEGYLKS